MKKSLFFYAAAALALTACTSENDILQTGPEKKAAPQEVGFDVYTPAATDVTRGGYNEGTMNTNRLQLPNVGFGIYGFYSDNNATNATPGYAGCNSDFVPNFMWNEHVLWNNTNKGWAYSPLKYWPNETKNDSQSEPAYMANSSTKYLDQLTFFAYAPYVDPSTSLGSEGITAITDNTGILTPAGKSALTARDPLVEYKVATDVNNGVDLLWGVAPAGDFTYTAVDKNSVTIDAGKPYINLTKPDVNTSLKFFFQHALARFGLTVAAAIDQVPQGGEIDTDETRVTIESVNLTGYFATEGILNLNNNANPNVANWIIMGNTTLGTSITDLTGLTKKTITIDNKNIAEHLQFTPGTGTSPVKPSAQVNVGVTHEKANLLKARFIKVDKPTSFAVSDEYYNHDGSRKYAEVTTIGGPFYYKEGNTYYNLKNASQYSTGTTYCTLPSATHITAATSVGVDNPGEPTDADLYKKVGDNYVLAFFTGATTITDAVLATNEYYTLGTPTNVSILTTDFIYPDGDYYKPLERSYYMVIPTNNIKNVTGITGDDKLKELHTISVEITYYVTTEDSKLADKRSQVKNVITKKVELPSLDNGKSYNLHLLLGLTSVKVEAEVGDWKESYIQTDLPQNTPGE